MHIKTFNEENSLFGIRVICILEKIRDPRGTFCISWRRLARIGGEVDVNTRAEYASSNDIIPRDCERE